MVDYFKLLWWAICGKIQIVEPSLAKLLHDTAQPIIRKI